MPWSPDFAACSASSTFFRRRILATRPPQSGLYPAAPPPRDFSSTRPSNALARRESSQTPPTVSKIPFWTELGPALRGLCQALHFWHFVLPPSCLTYNVPPCSPTEKSPVQQTTN